MGITGRTSTRVAALCLLVVAGDRKLIEPQLARLGKITVLPPVP